MPYENILKVKCQHTRQSPEQESSEFWVCFATCSQELKYFIFLPHFFLNSREKSCLLAFFSSIL